MRLYGPRSSASRTIATPAKPRLKPIPSARGRRPAGAGDTDRDEPCGAEATPTRQTRQPQRRDDSAVTAPAGRPLAARTSSPPLKALFRQAVKAITRPTEDAPKPRARRRSDETGRAFRIATKVAFRVQPSPSSQTLEAVTAYLSDTLDWLNLWHDAESSAACDNHDVNRNDLSLRL